MRTGLIGYTGFVGQTLLRQRNFDLCFRSTDIATIRGCDFDLVVCAGAPAQKWIANRAPEADRANIDELISHIDTLRCGCFVLISTVDVFRSPVGVDEATVPSTEGLHAYGANRLLLESFVRHRFLNHFIVRLPGLVGPRLRKNVIYDLLNSNGMEKLDPRSVFQFYPTVNLWADVEVGITSGLRLLHLTAEPISVREVAEAGFGMKLAVPESGHPVCYDFQSLHAPLFGAVGRYQYQKRETIQAIRHYSQSEPRASRD